VELYTYFRSSASYRVRIAMHLKGLSGDQHFVHLTRDGGAQHKPEFVQLNPEELVPCCAMAMPR
jgi:maleylpyruvate isomerase